MSNPYRAPRSNVQDPAPRPRPPQVTLAMRIFWAVFFLGFVTLHPDIRGEWWVMPQGDDPIDEVVQSDPETEAMLQSVGPVFIVGTTVVFAALYALLVWTTGKGYNWARWLLLAFVFGTTAMGAVDLGRSFAETPVAFAADVLFTLAEAYAFWLLFTGHGAEWFRQVH